MAATILGVQVSFDVRAQALQFWVGDEKSGKWIATIRVFLQRGRMSPAEAGKLAGKLSWAASAVFGRGMRAARPHARVTCGCVCQRTQVPAST